MRSDYNGIFYKVRNEVIKSGGFIAQEGDLRSQFFISSEWFLVLECERYYGPSFSLFLVPSSSPNDKFEIGLLMDSFCKLNGISFGPATIDNQFEFIRETDILGNFTKYKDEYFRLERMG